MIDRFERFSIFISDISRYWHKLTTAEMEKFGLKGTHSVYLATMARFPQGITAGQLCEICGKDKSDVSRMMNILEEKGLAVKEGGYQNRYSGAFRLTEAGLEAAAFVEKRASLAVAYAGKDLSEDERNTLYSALGLITGNLRELSEKGLSSIE